MRDLISQNLPILIRILEPLIAMYVGLLMRRYVHNDSVLKALDMVGKIIETSVGHAAQTTVHDLKDPSKPGTWDKVAAEAIKASVASDVKAMGQKPLAVLSQNGMDIEKLLDHGIEAAVKGLASK